MSQQPGLGGQRSEHEVVHLHHHSNTTHKASVSRMTPIHTFPGLAQQLVAAGAVLLPTALPLSNMTVRTFEHFFHISIEPSEIFPGLLKAASSHLLSVPPTFPGQHTTVQLRLVYSI